VALVAHAMKQIARRRFGTRPAIVHLIGQAVRSGVVWMGLALQALAFFARLALLSWADVSFVVPSTALNYVVGAAGSALLLRERVNRVRWAGVPLVCLGVGVMFASER
jgi:drug/metabolite transporter (DMT)-like permease